MENNRQTLHPALMIAAASVTALSLAGVGVLTGVLPFGQKSTDPASQLQAAAAQPAAVAPPAAQPPMVAVNVNTNPAPVAAARTAAPKPVRVARSTPSDIEVYRAPSQVRTSAPVYNPPAPAICRDCGTIESVREIAREAEGSGVGAVAGGVLGGVLGNQVGGGRGRTLATVGGAAGGAVVGNRLTSGTSTLWVVNVLFEDGSTQVIEQDSPPPVAAGDRVRVTNGGLQRLR